MPIALPIFLVLSLLLSPLLHAADFTPLVSEATLAKLKTADLETRVKASALIADSLQTLKEADKALARSETQALQRPSGTVDASLAFKATVLVNATAQKRWKLQQQIKHLEASLSELQEAAIATTSDK